MTPRILAALSAFLIAGPLVPQPVAADTLFMSTQLRPIEEAQKMRDVILKDYTGKATYVPEEPAQLPVSRCGVLAHDRQPSTIRSPGCCATATAP